MCYYKSFNIFISYNFILKLLKYKCGEMFLCIKNYMSIVIFNFCEEQ